MTLKDTISGFNLVPLAKRRFGRELCDGFFTSNTLKERTFCSVNLTMNGCSFNKICYIYTFSCSFYGLLNIIMPKNKTSEVKNFSELKQ